MLEKWCRGEKVVPLFFYLTMCTFKIFTKIVFFNCYNKNPADFESKSKNRGHEYQILKVKLKIVWNSCAHFLALLSKYEYTIEENHFCKNFVSFFGEERKYLNTMVQTLYLTIVVLFVLQSLRQNVFHWSNNLTSYFFKLL